MKKLVIVESPAKAKTIGKILKKQDFMVKSSVGHIRDLPVNELGVDLEHDFQPKYVVAKGKNKVIQELKKAAKQCDKVYLAPDPDREGEAIAWHLREVLKDSKTPADFVRVQYNEITKQAILKAFEQPGDIDLHRVDAQQARRILDRIVGYRVSPMLWKHIKRGLSAGRVQSVALRLVCEREQEINNFKPEAYWILGALVRKVVAPFEPFKIKLLRVNGKKAEVKSAEQAQRIRADLDGRSLRVTGVRRKTVSKRPSPPFITSSLQQAGSSVYRYSPRRTMAIAQKLYEGVDLGQGPVGLITYMRTDSFRVAESARGACRQLITETYGASFCPEKPNVYKSSGSAQDAHEAIRPTDVTLTPERVAKRLDPQSLNIYRLIWQRFVASQMAPAKIAQRSVQIEAVPPAEEDATYLFQVSSSDIVFPGYMKVSGAPAPSKDSDKDDESQVVPELAEGEVLQCLEWLGERKETTPPPRYSEASLVRTLEKNGVGRPSTYAQTVSTLLQREYVSREKRILIPTELGMKVHRFLVGSLDVLFDVKFTADMESALDKIEQGATEWTSMLEEFYRRFESWTAQVPEAAADPKVVQRVLDALENVREWAPPVKRGKRTYSDEKFVTSIRERLEAEKTVSPRQLDALLKIAAHYRDQVDEMAAVLKEVGAEELLKKPELGPPRSSSVEKLKLVLKQDLDDSTREFVTSLQERVAANRALTSAQVKALDGVVLRFGDRIENFEALRETLQVGEKELAERKQSQRLLEALKHVTEWRDPVQRGKRVFDDKAFYESLQGHFASKGFLSERQNAALGRLVKRYRDQIPGGEELAKSLPSQGRGRR